MTARVVLIILEEFFRHFFLHKKNAGKCRIEVLTFSLLTLCMLELIVTQVFPIFFSHDRYMCDVLLER